MSVASCAGLCMGVAAKSKHDFFPEDLPAEFARYFIRQVNVNIEITRLQHASIAQPRSPFNAVRFGRIVSRQI